jgi:predicted RNA binding protein YcfA (HicA-like mRNA interferase family)
MPQKVRELKSILLTAGFTYRSGKGSHTVWSHQDLDYSVILSGRDSADAQRYQAKDVRNALRDLAKLEEEDLE